MLAWSIRSVEEVARGDAQGGETVMGKLDENPLGLLADDVHLLDAGHMKQTLTHVLRVAHQESMRFPLVILCDRLLCST